MIEIGSRKIGPGEPPYFIADIGANHDGFLDRAMTLIDLAAGAGADAVKFQHFRPEKIVSRKGFEELGQIGHQAAWKRPVYETYERARVPTDWTPTLVRRCEAAGVAFLSTPYDLEAVDYLDHFVPAFKIGSGDITYLELIQHVASKRKPVFLATGASDAIDVGRALDAHGGHGAPLVLMQCNTNYTGDPENLSHLNLRVLGAWRRIFPGLPIGLSDHTPGHVAVCAAVALGACVIEKHFTDDRARVGPDHSFAMMPEEWWEMVKAAELTHAALGDGDGVKRVEENEREAAIVQRRALRYRKGLLRGRILEVSDVVPTRPCPPGGLPPYEKDRVVGHVLQVSVGTDTLVRREDFE